MEKSPHLFFPEEEADDDDDEEEEERPLSVEIPETTTKTNEEDLAGEKVKGETDETIQTTNKTKTVWTKPPSPRGRWTRRMRCFLRRKLNASR